MDVPVLLERSERGFRAKAWDLSAEGETREEALSRLEGMLAGNEYTTIQIPGLSHDWRRVAGMFADDPTFDEFLAIIEENRRIENEAEGIYPERNPEPERNK